MRSFFMRAFEVDHAGHPAVGYAIVSQTPAALKEEYKDLDGASIRELVKSGVSIKGDPIERIEVAYSGDTCARGLKRRIGDGTCIQPKRDIGQMFRAELLLCELTYLDSSDNAEMVRKANDRGHLHINELDGIFASHDEHFGDVASNGAYDCLAPGKIVFYHLSAKYQPATRALDLIDKGLPNSLRSRCHVAISSMLTNEEKLDENGIASLVRPNGCVALVDYKTWREADATK